MELAEQFEFWLFLTNMVTWSFGPPNPGFSAIQTTCKQVARPAHVPNGACIPGRSLWEIAQEQRASKVEDCTQYKPKETTLARAQCFQINAELIPTELQSVPASALVANPPPPKSVSLQHLEFICQRSTSTEQKLRKFPSASVFRILSYRNSLKCLYVFLDCVIPFPQTIIQFI